MQELATSYWISVTLHFVVLLAENDNFYCLRLSSFSILSSSNEFLPVIFKMKHTHDFSLYTNVYILH